MKGVGWKQLREAVLDGMVKANRSWHAYSGYWLASAPEYVINVGIAQAIGRLLPRNHRHVFLEANMRETIRSGGSVVRGRKAASLTRKGRYDVAVYYGTLVKGEAVARAVVEVKVRVETFLRIKRDVERIVASLKSGNHANRLRVGFLAVHLEFEKPQKAYADVRGRLEAVRERLLEGIRATVPAGLVVEAPHCSKPKVSDEGDGWQAVVFTIRRVKGRGGE